MDINGGECTDDCMAGFDDDDIGTKGFDVVLVVSIKTVDSCTRVNLSGIAGCWVDAEDDNDGSICRIDLGNDMVGSMLAEMKVVIVTDNIHRVVVGVVVVKLELQMASKG